MANPQKENGYTAIANEIMEHICKTTLNGTQFRIILFIWRQTYGWKNRKEFEMSSAFIAEGIGTNRNHVDRELATLIERKIVLVGGIGKRRGRLLSVNKNYEEWQAATATKEKPVTKKPSKPRKTKKYEEDNTYYKMAVYFLSKVKPVAEMANVGHLIAKANLQTWADDFRKLIELDNVDKRQAKSVMDWVVKDKFWRTNILSAKKFREQYAKLAIRMNEDKKPNIPYNQKPVAPDNRDREIAFQKHLAAGGSPETFDWSGDEQ